MFAAGDVRPSVEWRGRQLLEERKSRNIKTLFSPVRTSIQWISTDHWKNGKAGNRKTTSDSWESSVAAGKAQCVVVKYSSTQWISTDHSKNGKAGKRSTTSDSWESSVAAGKAQCVVVNAIDFKTPIDIATWPKHAAVEWLGRQNYSKNGNAGKGKLSHS
jgi:hypothetical protein